MSAGGNAAPQSAAQCPVCRARFRETRLCSRCGADLSGLMWIAARAWRLRRDARQALLNGDWKRAARAAGEACAARVSPEGDTLRVLSEWLAELG